LGVNVPVSRIANAFAKAKNENRAALVLYTMAGDPNPQISAKVLEELANGGADILELGFAFSDPMADGPSIQKAAIRALANQMTLKKTLAMAKAFRAKNQETALVLMGYLNPIESMGYDEFSNAASECGIDGMIIVDAPPEEDFELRTALNKNDIALIRLATPTTDEARLPKVIEGVNGFIYYVSVAGVTGVKAIDTDAIKEKVAKVRNAANLPVAIGFGIRTPQAAHDTAQLADGIVIGAALVDTIFEAYEKNEDCGLVALEYAKTMRAAAIKG
jgi:tryptophan synthase alpha chain